MKAPHCPKDGQFMRYIGRWMLGASTAPLGEYRCVNQHREIFELPWDMFYPKALPR